MDPVIKVSRISLEPVSLALRPSPRAAKQAGPAWPPGGGKPAGTQVGKPVKTAGLFAPPLSAPSWGAGAAGYARAADAGALPGDDVPPDDDAATVDAAKVKNIFEQAREAGHEAGMKDAARQIREEIDAAMAQIGALAQGLGEARQDLYREIEDTAVEVIFTSVTRILGRAATDRQLAVEMVQNVISQVKDRERLLVRVSPKDYEIVQAALQRSESAGQFHGNFQLVADQLVQLGGCVIESDAGSLDARLEIQIKHLKDALLTVREAHA
ncbi:MAG: hypothetical protein H7346_25045 [Burkholderiaceae bacterium]|nr:hypothetical protein [Burkholderiaceae bacterium]